MTGPGPHGAGDLLSSFLLPGHRVRRELPEPQEAGSDRAGLAAPAHPSAAPAHPSAAEAGAAAAAEEWAAAEEAPAEAEAQDAAEDKI